jgi:hypothetical protein
LSMYFEEYPTLNLMPSNLMHFIRFKPSTKLSPVASRKIFVGVKTEK